jgi:GMP synthase PP-ATPase subunit
MEPIGLGDVQDEQESGMRYDFDITLNLEMVEILEIVNQHLDVVLRADYLKMLDGVQVPSHKRRKVEEAIVEILHEHCGQSEGTEEWSLK